MMHYTDSELEALLNEFESDRAERKETWRGDAIAQAELKKNGNPPAEFVPEHSTVLAVIRRRPCVSPY